MADDNKKTKSGASEQARKQREAAQRTLDEQNRRTGDKQAAHTNSMATNKSHVGLAAHDPPKPDEMSALKTDQADLTGDPHVVRTPLNTEGKGTTDLVTSEPKSAQPQGGAAAGPGFADRAAAAAKTGKGKKGRGRKKAASA